MAWGANEIKQGDSGLVVSNKLDAEFSRIQQKEAADDLKFVGLTYTNQTTILDKTQDSLIVSPWTLWSVIDPILLDVAKADKVTNHLEEILFDSVFWIRSDVMFEYSGAYVPLSSMKSGNFLTYAHLGDISDEIRTGVIFSDGSIPMDATYTPLYAQSVATKYYVDDLVATLDNKAQSNYMEYPAAAQGDSVYAGSYTGKNILVYLNGVMMRTSRYVNNGTNVTFNSSLDEGDEVTIAVLGDK